MKVYLQLQRCSVTIKLTRTYLHMCHDNREGAKFGAGVDRGILLPAV